MTLTKDTWLRAPFPWYGGKRRVADDVWQYLGTDCGRYVEPFAGSLGVLLGRPSVRGPAPVAGERGRRAVAGGPADRPGVA